MLLANSLFNIIRFTHRAMRKEPAIRTPESPAKRRLNFSGIVAQAFEPWPYELPCFEPQENWLTPKVQRNKTGAEMGFHFMKPQKTGSSTTSGINLRIARNVAQRLNKSYEFCRARFDHGPSGFPAADLFANRDPERSFLWSVIREPTKRIISQFFHFEVSRGKKEPSDENFRNFILNSTSSFYFRDYYYKTLYTQSHFDRKKEDPIQIGNEILSEYDFLGITERMDESAVVLMMLLNLKLSDVLYLSSKSSGGFDDLCKYVWPSFVTPAMQEFFESDVWQDRVQYDSAIYQAVNASLDLTIDKLGRKTFETLLAKFKHARAEVQNRCLPITVFPCDFSSGRQHMRHKTDCVWNDSGCGMECLDVIAAELGMA